MRGLPLRSNIAIRLAIVCARKIQSAVTKLGGVAVWVRHTSPIARYPLGILVVLYICDLPGNRLMANYSTKLSFFFALCSSHWTLWNHKNISDLTVQVHKQMLNCEIRKSCSQIARDELEGVSASSGERWWGRWYDLIIGLRGHFVGAQSPT
jgi:hypothetical protein